MKTSPVKTVWKWLTSKKLAIALIATLTVVVTTQVLFLARVWSPTSPNLAAQAGRMYSSWWFILLSGGLLVNLSACTLSNLCRRLKSGTRSTALWGSTVFHAGLIVIIIGTLITGQYRIFCSITLIQGEPKSIPYQALLTEATAGFDANDRFTITLLDQKAQGQQTGMERQTYSDIEIKGTSTVRIKTEMTDSQQLSYRDIYLFPSKYGYAVHVTVRDPEGRTVASTSVPLETVEYGENEHGGNLKEYSKTGISLGNLPFTLAMTLYPSQQPPQLRITATGNIGGTVRKGGTIELAGYQITFDNSLPWTQLMTAFDPGAKVVFTGILLSLTGQIMLVLAGRKTDKFAEVKELDI